MSIINNGGPAFPTTDFTHAGQVIPGSEGMTLRDYFAAKAMPAVYADYCEGAKQTGFDEGWMDGVAHDAYAMANAMLKAREAK